MEPPDRDARGEPPDLGFPVAEQRRRADHQRRPRRELSVTTVQVQRDQGDRLAESHVVCEAGAEPGAGQLGQPGHAPELVVAERRLQPGGRIERGNGGRVDHAVAHLEQRCSRVHPDLLTADVEHAGERGAQRGHRRDRFPGAGGRTRRDPLAGLARQRRVDHDPVVTEPDDRRRSRRQ